MPRSPQFAAALGRPLRRFTASPSVVKPPKNLDESCSSQQPLTRRSSGRRFPEGGITEWLHLRSRSATPSAWCFLPHLRKDSIRSSKEALIESIGKPASGGAPPTLETKRPPIPSRGRFFVRASNEVSRVAPEVSHPKWGYTAASTIAPWTPHKNKPELRFGHQVSSVSCARNIGGGRHRPISATAASRAARRASSKERISASALSRCNAPSRQRCSWYQNVTAIAARPWSRPAGHGGLREFLRKLAVWSQFMTRPPHSSHHPQAPHVVSCTGRPFAFSAAGFEVR